MPFFLLCLVFLLNVKSFATLQLPANLNESDQQKITRDLGTGLSPRLIGQTFPLGGYDGTEIGAYRDMIATGDISTYGSGANSQDSTGINSLMLGKGFYYDLDFYLFFSPLGESEAMQNVGGAVKWTFYEGDSVPLFVGVQTGLHSANVENEINLTGENALLYAGLHFLPVQFYAGFGIYRATGHFVANINQSGLESNVSIAQDVFVAGASYSYRRFLLQFSTLTAAETNYEMGLYFKL